MSLLKSIIGLLSNGRTCISKRVFDTNQEAAEWLYLFPKICTEGIITNWRDAVEKDWQYADKYHYISSLKIIIVKWIKQNLSIKNDQYEYMGLKEAKYIFDLLEDIIKMNIYFIK